MLFRAGVPSEVVLDMILSRGVLFTGSGEGCCLLGLGDCSGAGAGGAAGTDHWSTWRPLVIGQIGGTWVPAPPKCDRKLPA